ncbi:MAG: response regulator [Dehalococcoidales bacterium]|nr:response regulator [Dehalococcoidales bacterium]
MKILIAEDNEDSSKLLVKQLRALSYEVSSAANGKEALSQGLKDPPDVLVSDILMPEMDGYGLCMEWKQNEKLRSIPVIFFTATYTSDEDEKFARSLGADAFIHKPVELEDLVQILIETVEKSRLDKQHPAGVASGGITSGGITSDGVASARTLSIESSNFLIEHNKRLLARLYHKVAQLETDILERKRAEEAVRESEEKFRQFFENAQIFCYILSPEGIILEINQTACQALGYTKEELIDQPLGRICPPEYLPRFRELVREWNRTNLIKNEEMTVLTQKGEKRDVIFSAGVIRNGEGKITSVVSVQRDITELKRIFQTV